MPFYWRLQRQMLGLVLAIMPAADTPAGLIVIPIPPFAIRLAQINVICYVNTIIAVTGDAGIIVLCRKIQNPSHENIMTGVLYVYLIDFCLCFDLADCQNQVFAMDWSGLDFFAVAVGVVVVFGLDFGFGLDFVDYIYFRYP